MLPPNGHGLSIAETFTPLHGALFCAPILDDLARRPYAVGWRTGDYEIRA
jgi:hypothetical protein